MNKKSKMYNDLLCYSRNTIGVTPTLSNKALLSIKKWVQNNFKTDLARMKAINMNEGIEHLRSLIY